MKKEVTNEEVKELLKYCVEKIKEEESKQINLAKIKANNAEIYFRNSFTEEQKLLYKEWMKAKQEYIDLLVEKAKKEM